MEFVRKHRYLISGIAAVTVLTICILCFPKHFMPDSASVTWTMLAAIGAVGAFVTAAAVYISSKTQESSLFYLNRCEQFLTNALHELERVKALQDSNEPQLSAARILDAVLYLDSVHALSKKVTKHDHVTVFNMTKRNFQHNASHQLSQLRSTVFTGYNTQFKKNLESLIQEHLLNQICPTMNEPEVLQPINQKYNIPFKDGIPLRVALRLFRYCFIPNADEAAQSLSSDELEQLQENQNAASIKDYVYTCTKWHMKACNDGYAICKRNMEIDLAKLIITEPT